RELLAPLLHLMGDGDGVGYTLLHVVGIHEQDAVLGLGPSVRAEGLELRRERLHPRMRMRAGDGDPVPLTCHDVGRGSTTTHVRSAGGRGTAIRTLSATQAELGHRATAGGHAH